MLLMVNMEMENYFQKMNEEVENKEIDESLVMNEFQQNLLAAEQVKDSQMVKELKKKSNKLATRKAQVKTLTMPNGDGIIAQFQLGKIVDPHNGVKE